MSSEAAEALEPVLDAASEAILEGVDDVVDVVEVVRNNPMVLVTVGTAGLLLGGVGGYFLAVKRLGKKFDERLSVELEETRLFYQGLTKTDDDGAVMSPMEVLEERHPEAAATLREYQGRHDEIDNLQNSEAVMSTSDEEDEKLLAKTESKVVVKEETRNTFADPIFDLEVEKNYRTPEKPYIITHDEFYAAERDYETSSLTYYESDDTLVDERDAPIDDLDIVGPDHLVRFGHGSRDNNVVYIRNEKLGTDYEITRSKGSYLVEVLGFPEEEKNSLKHSDSRDRRREFRRGNG